MKTNIKVTVDRPPVSSEEIAARQNFNGVLDRFKQLDTPFYQKPWFLGTIIGMAVIVGAIILVARIKQHKELNAVKQEITRNAQMAADTATAQPVAFFKPKVQGAEVPFAQYEVLANKGGKYKYRTGSEISVPAGAFLDADGKPVKGAVTLRYREFHNPVEIIASGIPMTYDSANNMYHFQSAGMLEIRAYQDGKALTANPDKPIGIRMATQEDGTAYNLYNLDSAGSNWRFMKAARPESEDGIILPDNRIKTSLLGEYVRDTTKAITQNEFVRNIMEQKLADLPKLVKPLALQKADPMRPHFGLDILPQDFPELADYKNLTYEVLPENKNFKPEAFKVEWEDVVLDTLPQANKYKLTLIKGQTKESYIVSPVFMEADYNKAVETYRKKYDAYQKKRTERLAYEKKVKEDADKQYQQWLADVKKQQEEAQKQYFAKQNTESKLSYVFTVNNFGIYNCDAPCVYPHNRMIRAAFQDEQGQALKLDYVYLVEKDRNAVFTYYGPQYKQFGFNPAKENMIVAVTDSGKVYVVRSNDFAAMPGEGKNHTFTMHTSKEQFHSPAELAAFMGLETAASNKSTTLR